MGSTPISHVSDTSLWVAVHRAREGERPDALFKDPLALVLAGKEGLDIAEKMSSPRFMQWLMALRTIAIDELVKECVALGVDTVINLGAGLDTRPYRMELPPNLRWIEVDFKPIIDLKNDRLSSYKPVVALERFALDLGDINALQTFLSHETRDADKVLVITEGVIPYLANEDVEALARALKQQPKIKYWIQDFRRGGFRQVVPRFWMKRRMGQVQFKFTVTDWFGFFARFGWALEKEVLLSDEAVRRNRPFPMEFPWVLMVAFLPKKKQEQLKNAAGIALLRPE